MRVDTLCTSHVLSSLRSPLVLPWRRRTFLLLRRRHKASTIPVETTTKHKNPYKTTFRALGPTAPTVKNHKEHQLSSVMPTFSSSHQEVERKRDEPDLLVSETFRCGIKRKPDSGEALHAISGTVDIFHQNRRLRRLKAIQIKQNLTAADEPKKLMFPVSPCKRTPSKKKVMQATGLLSISPIARPANKKQRFFWIEQEVKSQKKLRKRRENNNTWLIVNDVMGKRFIKNQTHRLQRSVLRAHHSTVG